MGTTKPSPEKITRLATGGWACAALGTALRFSLFNHVDAGCRTVEQLADAAKLSVRGTRALLDALVGFGLLTIDGGQYRNSPEAAEFLIDGKSSYSGGFARIMFQELDKWAQLADVVKTGTPARDVHVAENPFWEDLVLSIASGSMPNAQAAAASLRLSEAGAISTLDVGGGSGVFSAVFLKANPKVRATQVDWSNVNRVARTYVAGHDVADRFHTIDGNFHEVDLGQDQYDVAVYSHIAHGEPPEENITMFRKMHGALKEGGTLVVVDFIQSDDHAGPPFALMFHLNMLVNTQEGATYTEGEYRSWLTTAGFRDITIEHTQGPASLIYAR